MGADGGPRHADLLMMPVRTAPPRHRQRAGHSGARALLLGVILVMLAACARAPQRVATAPVAQDGVQQDATPAVAAAANEQGDSAAPTPEPAAAPVTVSNPLAETDLVIAARFGQADLVSAALAAGADVEQRDALGNTALIAAAGAGHPEIVSLLLEQGAGVDDRSRDGTTALMAASRVGNADVVNRLLLADAGIDLRNDEGESALQQAVKYRHLDVTHVLLSHGADPDIRNSGGNRDYRGYSALMYAADHGIRNDGEERDWLPLVAALLDGGADPNLTRVNGETALSIAGERGDDAIVAALREAGARDERDYVALDANRALLRAAELNDAEKARELLDEAADADPDSSENGVTPLLVSSARGNQDVVKILVEKGADVNHTPPPLSEQRIERAAIPDPEKEKLATAVSGDTPLISAVRNDHPDTVSYLLEKGADINQPNRHSETPGLLAARLGRSDIMDMLLDRGLDPDLPIATEYNDYFIASILKQEKARALLIEAVLKDHADTARVLLQRGGNPNVRDRDGRTALSWAAEMGYRDVAQVLLEFRSEVDARDNLGRTPLIYAAMKGHAGLVELLLAHDADVNAMDGRQHDYGTAVEAAGETALIHATRNGHLAVVRTLLSHGADTGLGGSHGETAEKIARERGYEGIVRLLAAQGF